ncbi:MAG: methyltransferase domain-containing protein [Deltaproteobacteria bacterium]|nr:methyltransferase domain-containing protein [Deltaproteobacteria bacterium]
MGIIRPARRPKGWVARGPRPAGDGGDAELSPGENEDLCYLLGDFRLFQRIDGHRWSVDDLVTAAVAARVGATPDPPSVCLDLGCGIGSVLQMVAWNFVNAKCIGIEAQPESVGLARRSIRYNGLAERVKVLDGDLRTFDFDGLTPREFDLITGTPPYFIEGTGPVSTRPQRGPCRFEHRGGAAEYVLAGHQVLHPDGTFVLCCGPGQTESLATAANTCGLQIANELSVIGRPGRSPRFFVFTLNRRTGGSRTHQTLVVRDEEGQWTPAFRMLRTAMGMP